MSEPYFEASEPVGDPIVPTSVGGGVKRKQQFNVYTVMLIISFFCLLVGTLLLLMEMNNYGDLGEWPWKTEEGRPNSGFAIDLLRFRV